MALRDAVDRYTEVLRSMISEGTANVAAGQASRLEMRRDTSAESAEAGTQDESQARTDARFAERAEPRLASLAETAARYLSVSEELGEELAGIGSHADDRVAALMGGHWLAAIALTAAAESALPEPQAGIDSLRRMLVLHLPDSEALAGLAAEPEVPAIQFLLAHALGHDVPEVALGLLGEPSVRGGAADPVDTAATRIIYGLVSSANSIAASAAAGSLLPPFLSTAVASFAHHKTLAEIVPGAAAVERIKKIAINVIQRAVALARRFIGDQAVDTVEKWIRDNVTGFIENAEQKLARRVLGIVELEAVCRQVLDALPHTAAISRQADLDSVSVDYDKWAKWGSKGTRLLAMVPTAALGAAALPVVALAVVALLSYEVWIAWDHLDWPRWPLPDRAEGVAGAIGVSGLSARQRPEPEPEPEPGPLTQKEQVALGLIMSDPSAANRGAALYPLYQDLTHHDFTKAEATYVLAALERKGAIEYVQYLGEGASPGESGLVPAYRLTRLGAKLPDAYPDILAFQPEYTYLIRVAGDENRNMSLLRKLQALPHVQRSTRFIADNDPNSSVIKMWSYAKIETRKVEAAAAGSEIISLTETPD
jgi:hypothetical protein